MRQVSSVDPDQAAAPCWIVNGKLLRGDFFQDLTNRTNEAEPTASSERTIARRINVYGAMLILRLGISKK
jgi:hypothetical protein